MTYDNLTPQQAFYIATYKARQQARAWALRHSWHEVRRPNFARRLLRYYRARQQAALHTLRPAIKR